MKELFEYALKGRISSRINYARVKVSFRKSNMGKKSLSYIGLSVWNKLLNSMKGNITLNMFKYDVRNIYTRIKNVILLSLSLLLTH